MSKYYKGILPIDTDSDSSLPGRFEESNLEHFEAEYVKPKPKNKGLLIIVIAFLVFSSGFFSYSVMKQNDIESQLIQNMVIPTPEQKLVNQHGIGKYGSEHSHAAIAIFVKGEQLNFALTQFQMSSKYIHFENHNPYLIHKHATGVPLEMLFSSLKIKITEDCMLLNYYESTQNRSNKFCTDQDKSLVFYVNGSPYDLDLSQYVLDHNDRILVSYGDSEQISEQLAYLKSLKIFDIPKKTPQYPGDGITI
ncbi:MAG: hypothetical protein OEQ12_08185 [Nitrosopumilus sp.]|nr:hypothetical protein [Nitrosopumilus sp.]